MALKNAPIDFISLLAKLFFILRHQYLKLLLFKGPKWIISTTRLLMCGVAFGKSLMPQIATWIFPICLYFSFSDDFFRFLEPGKKVDLECRLSGGCYVPKAEHLLVVLSI